MNSYCRLVVQIMSKLLQINVGQNEQKIVIFTTAFFKVLSANENIVQHKIPVTDGLMLNLLQR